MTSNQRRALIRVAGWLGRDNVALASYPRSGNTWLALLIEALAGRRTGSVYQDRVHPRPALGVVIKTHRRDGALYRRAIHLARDPFAAIASYHDYLRELRGAAPPWEAHVPAQAAAWAAHTAYWLDFAGPTLRVRYEDLRADTPAVLARVARFTGLREDAEALSGAVRACSLERLQDTAPQGDKFFRGGLGERAGARYTDELRAVVDAATGPLRRRLGYA